MTLFLCGFCVGMLSLIPGISAGTILLISHQYEMIATYISHPKQYISKLLILLFGILIGILATARIIEWCFMVIPHTILFFFGGIVLFSLPKMLEKENGIAKMNPFYFLLGTFIVGGIYILSVEQPYIITSFPKITLSFLLFFSAVGILDGIFTIFPGISGSMIMMILGPYYLYKSYLAQLSFSHVNFLLPLLFYFIGDLIGLFLGSKLSLFLLRKWHDEVMSLIYGMVLMSAIVILPFSTVPNIFIAILPLAASFLLTQLFQ